MCKMEGLIRRDGACRSAIRTSRSFKPSSHAEEKAREHFVQADTRSRNPNGHWTAKQSFAPPGGFDLRRLFKRSSVSETERVRGGGGPLDNLVVLITSLALLVILGVGLLWYLGYWPGGHPTLTEHG